MVTNLLHFIAIIDEIPVFVKCIPEKIQPVPVGKIKIMKETSALLSFYMFFKPPDQNPDIRNLRIIHRLNLF